MKAELTTATAEDEGKMDVGTKKPTLYSMVLLALGNNKTSKGLTIQGIKKAVITEHPDTQENFSNKRLQNALKKGLDSTEIVRPKSSEHEGLKGYFLLNRALIAQKAKKKKVSKTASKGEDTDKPKKSKTTKAEKSEKSKDSKTTKKPKKANDVTTIKSKVAKKKPLTAKASNSKTKSTPKATKRRDTISATPKISKADKTKAGTAKRKLLNKTK